MAGVSPATGTTGILPVAEAICALDFAFVSVEDAERVAVHGLLDDDHEAARREHRVEADACFTVQLHFLLADGYVVLPKRLASVNFDEARIEVHHAVGVVERQCLRRLERAAVQHPQSPLKAGGGIPANVGLGRDAERDVVIISVGADMQGTGKTGVFPAKGKCRPAVLAFGLHTEAARSADGRVDRKRIPVVVAHEEGRRRHWRIDGHVAGQELARRRLPAGGRAT